MQVRIIKPGCTGPNPAFDVTKPVDRDNYPEIPKPVGLMIAGPMAHFLCYGDDPIAEPVDEEAKSKLEQYFQERAEVEVPVRTEDV